eukprot:7432055-Alexandrium_andersonii.AAC.1
MVSEAKLERWVPTRAGERACGETKGRERKRRKREAPRHGQRAEDLERCLNGGLRRALGRAPGNKEARSEKHERWAPTHARARGHAEGDKGREKQASPHECAQKLQAQRWVPTRLG